MGGGFGGGDTWGIGNLEMARKRKVGRGGAPSGEGKK